METETKPVWTTTREAMGKVWTIGLYPNDVVLGGSDGSGSALQASVTIRDQLIAIKSGMGFNHRDETLLHELIETCLVEMEIPYKHPDVDRLSFALFAFLRGFGLWHDFPWPDRTEEK